MLYRVNLGKKIKVVKESSLLGDSLMEIDEIFVSSDKTPSLTLKSSRGMGSEGNIRSLYNGGYLQKWCILLIVNVS